MEDIGKVTFFGSAQTHVIARKMKSCYTFTPARTSQHDGDNGGAHARHAKTHQLTILTVPAGAATSSKCCAAYENSPLAHSWPPGPQANRLKPTTQRTPQSAHLVPPTTWPWTSGVFQQTRTHERLSPHRW